MKHLIKFAVIVFSTMLLIFSCQKDYVTTEEELTFEESSTYKKLALSEIEELQPVVNKIKKLTPQVPVGMQVRDFSFLSLDSLDVDNIKEYTDTNGYSTWTFKIKGDEDSINFENLHLLETDNGYIGYIMSFEPNEIWYNDHLKIIDGEKILDMKDYTGEMTKYSLERDEVWSTKDLERAGEFITVCVYTVNVECACHTEGHEVDPQGQGCNCISYNVIENCNTVWSSGGSNSNNNGNNSGDSDGNDGASGSSNNDDCDTSGTVFNGSEPLSGINGDCAPNDTIGIIPDEEEEIICNVSPATQTNVINCIIENSFIDPELQSFLLDEENSCTLSEIASFLGENGGCTALNEEFIEILIESLEEDDCGYLPNIADLSDIEVEFNSFFFGDYEDPDNQQDHDAIKSEYEELLISDGNAAAVNYLINIYSMEVFGSNAVNSNYSIEFSPENADEGDAFTVCAYDGVTGDLISCEITIEEDLLTGSDFGYITRAVKHELYHVLQAQFYGFDGISDEAKEFDAYFSSLFRFSNLPRIDDAEKIIQLVVWLEQNWDNMGPDEKSIRQDQYNIVVEMFPKICKD